MNVSTAQMDGSCRKLLPLAAPPKSPRFSGGGTKSPDSDCDLNVPTQTDSELQLQKNSASEQQARCLLCNSEWSERRIWGTASSREQQVFNQLLYEHDI